MITYALIIPVIECSVSLHTVWFILFLSRNYIVKLRYQTETKEMQRTLKTKKTQSIIFKEIYWKVTAVGMGVG